MACLKTLEAPAVRGSRCSPWERMTGSHLQTGACTSSLLMAIWACTRGYKREVHTGAQRAVTAQHLAMCPDPHWSVYDNKSCRSVFRNMHPYIHLTITLLLFPSNKQALILKDANTQHGPLESTATSTPACQRLMWCNATTPLLWQKSVFSSST